MARPKYRAKANELSFVVAWGVRRGEGGTMQNVGNSNASCECSSTAVRLRDEPRRRAPASVSLDLSMFAAAAAQRSFANEASFSTRSQ